MLAEGRATVAVSRAEDAGGIKTEDVLVGIESLCHLRGLGCYDSGSEWRMH
jgi:hypothetical protein